MSICAPRCDDNRLVSHESFFYRKNKEKHRQKSSIVMNRFLTFTAAIKFKEKFSSLNISSQMIQRSYKLHTVFMVICVSLRIDLEGDTLVRSKFFMFISHTGRIKGMIMKCRYSILTSSLCSWAI